MVPRNPTNSGHQPSEVTVWGVVNVVTSAANQMPYAEERARLQRAARNLIGAREAPERRPAPRHRGVTSTDHSPTLPADTMPRRALFAGRLLLRAVAVVVLIAGIAKFVDLGLPRSTALSYPAWQLAALGAIEIGLASAALARPGRLTGVVVTLFMGAVTLYVLSVPPEELERVGCACFGERVRFQDVRSHVRLNGVLLLLAATGSFAVGRPGSE